MNRYSALGYYAALTALAVQWPSEGRFSDSKILCARVYDFVLPIEQVYFTFGTFTQEVAEKLQDGVQ